MAYLRVKWVKGYPYLYEQESYREGGRVRTRHIRYLPRYRWTGTIGGVGFTPPSDLHPASKAYVDNEITKLEYCDKYPYERDILKHYLYFQNYILTVRVYFCW